MKNRGLIKKDHKISIYLIYVTASIFFLAATCDKNDLKIIVDAADVTDITATSATCGGNVFDDGGAFISARGVVWAKSAGATIDSNLGITVDGTGLGSFTSLLTGLEPATRYYVRAYATNANGTAYSQQTMTFITLE